ncbi:uracil-xanthine permease family protein [Mesoplasma corruscae]|uniref:Uracil permease n=1 Tax=Mesoplasma corruscae TaxID=216874 RepID=A0A2S5RHB6_9MOLU|nr:uracil-xanthine permease family protein [Mesoplasma corruscae]PPE06691.1 uracil permease [Mesoplasma corruscae]
METILDKDKVALALDVHEKPRSKLQWTILSLQHVFAMFGSNVLVPMIINSTICPSGNFQLMNPSMALFASGLGTLIYIALTKAKVPVYLGSSFAYMIAVGTSYKNYGNSVFFAIMFVGLIYILFGITIYFLGSGFVKKIFPPIVVGPLIVIIGLSAAPASLVNSGITGKDWSEVGNVNYPQWIAFLIAFITFIAIVIITIKAKGISKIIPVIIGIAVGFLTAIIIHISKPSWGLIDTSKITDVSKWEWYPSFQPFWKDITVKKIGLSIIAIAPLAIVGMSEHIGDHISIGMITNKDFVKDPGLHRTLIADGVSIIIDGFIGGPPNTTYGENTAVVGITRIASVWVTGFAAVIAIILAFIAPVNQTISMIPAPVMGGIGMVMFGFISINGIRILATSDVDFLNMKNIFVTSTILVLGIVLSIIGDSIFGLPGIGIAAFAGILLNLLLPEKMHQGMLYFSIFNRKKTKKSK